MKVQTVSTRLKQNVDQFSHDVDGRSGYVYTTDAPFSSVVANQRLTDATLGLLGAEVRTVVDIGCGDGTYTSILQSARPYIVFSGFDASKIAVVRAAKAYPEIRFWVDNVLAPKITPKDGFDVGVIRGLLHHTDDPAQAIAEMARVARTLIIIEPNGNNPVLKAIEKLSTYHREHEERSFLPWRPSQWCKLAGCRIESLNHAGFVPFFCPEQMARVLHVAQPYLERTPVVRSVLSAVSIIKCTRI